MARYEKEKPKDAPYNALRDVHSGSRGGVDESERHGRGYGAGKSRREKRGHEKEDRDSMNVAWGSQSSGKSSGSRK